MDAQYKYYTEYSRSSTSECKKCKKIILKDRLRLAKLIQLEKSDNKTSHFYHFDCFFEINKSIKSIEEIERFYSIRYVDQQRIRNKIYVVDIGYSKTEAICMKCKSVLNKGEIMYYFKDRENDEPYTDQCYHVECFHSEGSDILRKVPYFDLKKLPGLKGLSDIHCNELIESPSIKLTKDDSEFEAAWKSQNELIWELIPKLQELSNEVLKDILEYNTQYIPNRAGTNDLTAILSDRMLFGCINIICPECFGILDCRNSIEYVCTGCTAWVDCLYKTRVVTRSKFEVQNNYLVHNVFKDYRYVERTRVLPNISIETSPKNGEALRDSTNNNNQIYQRSLPEDKIKIQTVKKGGIVDSDSGLVHEAHVFRDSETNDLMDVLLSKVNLVRGQNAFYKLQLLESDVQNTWWIFRKYGRIGKTSFSNITEPVPDLNEALNKFCKILLDKTGNEWCNRDNFQKKPNLYYPVDIDNEHEKFFKELSTVDQPSKLPIEVQQLIEFIFDEDSMENVMLEFEIDLNKMPLGKLSKEQINKSYEVLCEIYELLKGPEVPTNTQLFGASNRFYTLLPHDFGIENGPLIDSIDFIIKKCEMIENLREIEVAYKILESESDECQIDYCYNRLRNRINVVEKGSEVFNRIKNYMNNTNDGIYKLEIINIFNLVRENEEFNDLPNHMMLWHGSRRTNWAGILSQGLRIEPLKAPVTGRQLGKGIYFADMVSKSANYCFPSSSDTEGMLLLCEVALGNVTERKPADERVVWKKGEHSCLGVGQTYPDPSQNYVDNDGVVYPMGKPMERVDSKAVSLLYNEYIVYNEAQVRQRYLVRFKYN